MPFSDGVLFDPADRLFKMWYMAGYGACHRLATSSDGIPWTKPSLDVVRGTNIVMHVGRDSNTVWLDLDATDPRPSLQDGALRSPDARPPVKSSRRTAFTGAARRQPARRRSDRRSSTIRSACLGVQPSRTASNIDGDPRRAATGESTDFERAHWTAADPGRMVSADGRDSGARFQSCVRSSTTWIASRTKRPAGAVLHLAGRVEHAPQAQRHLRRVQPRRLPLEPPRSPAVHRPCG